MHVGDFGLAENSPSSLLELLSFYRGAGTAVRTVVFTGLLSPVDGFRLVFFFVASAKCR